MITQIFLACFFITTLQMNLSAQEEAGLSAEQKIQKAQEHYLKGKELIQAQDYQAADEEFKKAQQLLEGTSPVKPAEAIAQEDKPLPTPIETTAKVVTPTPESVVNAAKAPSLSESASLVMKAKEFNQNGQLEQAVSLYLKAVELAPNNPDLHYNLAVEYLKTYRYSLAEEEFKRVLDLNPKDKDAYYNLGVLYESYIIDKKQAISCYTQYLKFAPRAKDRDKVKGWIRQINQEMIKK
jgi:tetratricopeptide (TPR) repeat protein